MEIERDETPELIQNIVRGEFEIDACLQYWEKVVASYGDKPVLWNFEDCSLGNVNLDSWKDMVSRTEQAAEVRRNCRAALLGTKMNIGLLQLIESIAGRLDYPVNVKAFMDVAEAKSWLLEQ